MDATPDPAPVRSGRSLRWVFLLFLASMVFAFGVAPILGAHDRSRLSDCDVLFVSLDAEIVNALDAGIPATDVIDRVIESHIEQTNPRDRRQPGYVQQHDPTGPNFLGTGDPIACQVVLRQSGPHEIQLIQPPTPDDEGGGERSLRFGIEPVPEA